MNVKSRDTSDFFVRSKDTKKFARNESDHDESLNSASEKSTPVKEKKQSRKTFVSSSRRDEPTTRAKTNFNKESENESEDDEYHEKRFHATSSVKKTGRSERSISRISSLSERSRQSFSTDSDDQGRDNTFDTNGNEEETESSAIQQASPIKKKTSADLLAEESSQLLLSQGITEGSFWNVLTYGRPKHRSKEELEECQKLTFYPSSSPAKPDDKLVDDIEARVAEEEGLYAGEPLRLPSRNLNRLENRLIKEKSLDWFGANGKLLGLPDPYRVEPVKLCPNESKQAEFQKNIVFVPAKLDPYQELQLDLRQAYEVVLELGTIQFTHHPYFSKEHVLAARLEEAFVEYTARNLMKQTERASNKLKALREAVLHTKQTCKRLTEQLENGDIEADHQKELKESLKACRERIRSYRVEMQRTSLERDQGYWDDRLSLVTVLELWKAIKALRNEQGFSNTNLKLSIMEIPVDYKEDKAAWQRAIEEEFNDLKDEYDENLEIETQLYNQGMQKYANLRREEQKKRVKGMLTQEMKSDSDEDTATDDRELANKRPKSPAKFDAESTMKAIEKRHTELRRQPGEPILTLQLLKTASVTLVNQLPDGATKEKQRRKVVQSLNIEIKVWFNGNEVYRSRPKVIQGDFSGFLGLSIPITIKEWPESLEIELIDVNSKLKSDLVKVPLPDSNTSIDRCLTQRLQFTSYDVVKVSHDGVGSGVSFEIMGKEFAALYPRGYVTTRIGWSTDLDGNILCPVGLDKLKFGFGSDVDTKTKQGKTLMKGKNDYDPNDPKHSQWLNSKQSVSKEERSHQLHPIDIGVRQTVAAERVDDGFDLNDGEFCSMESIEQSRRYRLLRLRDEEVPEFKSLRMIPAFEHDIPADIFNQYERRLKEDMRKRSGADPSLLKPSRKKLLDDESLYESNRLEKIREMRLSVLQLFENSTKQITFEDLVAEEQIPDIGTLGLNLMALFQPRRPLRPTRKERKRVQGSNLIDTKVNLIVNIVRAFNLPMRKDTDVGLLTTESLTGVQLSTKRMDRGAGNYATVKPFVEVWFQRNVCRTTTALGSNPTWNQELQLNLSVPNDDYSQANLSRMDDLVYFHVYDEVAIDLLEDDRRRETDIHQRLEKRWLGTISIPFSTLYTNGRIEGTFKLNSPSILLGYEAQGMASHFGSIVGKSGLQNLGKGHGHGTPFSNQKSAFITIFLTLQPSVTPLSCFKEDSHSGETPDMVAHIKNWKNMHEMEFPDRIIKPFVMTSEGDTVLCTRFLKPIEPPNSLLVNDNDLLRTMEDLAHYVSLFPCVRDSTLGIVEYSLWFNSDIFVSAPGGGIEDHSVLLACYFMHMNVPCWIAQGNAIPDGPTAFVVTSFKGLPDDKAINKQMKNMVLIWNACTGDYYHANDNFCPLQRVWAVIGSSNVWANIGEGERPHQIDWDISKSKFWLPLFAKPVPESKLPSIQATSVRYKPPDQVQANSLAQRIERHLKEVFMKWRPTSKTNWNRYCSATLRRLLPKLEESKLGRMRGLDLGATAESAATLQSGTGSSISLSEEHLIELREIMASYQMTGFPLQQAYTNMECIIETVYATGVHTIDAPDVEFAVAAYAHAYPASVYSVWVYVAALHRRK